MSLRFLLDEHVHRAIQRQLRRHSAELVVVAVGDPDAPPRGTSDPDLLLWIESNGHILVTEDRSTMPAHLAAHFAAGRHVPGVIWIRPGSSIGSIVTELFMIATLSSEEEFRDQTMYIPL